MDFKVVRQLVIKRIDSRCYRTKKTNNNNNNRKMTLESKVPLKLSEPNSIQEDVSQIVNEVGQRYVVK